MEPKSRLQKEALPSLPLDEWEKTKMTFHLFLQIIGKIRLQFSPRKNHWWNVTHYVNTRGLTTFSIPYANGTEVFEMSFDLIDHQFIIQTSKGEKAIHDLYDGLSVADFYHWVVDTLKHVGIEVKIQDKPFDLPAKGHFREIKEWASYQKEYMHRFWRILLWVDGVFKEFSGRFYGKTCPAHIYWHHMDLAMTRFSGRKGPRMESDSIVEKEAYSHEVVSFGFWAGDDQVREPAFYSYTYPLPKGIDQQPLQPKTAQWVESNGSPMAFLTYDKLRQSDNPRQDLLDFMESAYQAGGSLAGWNLEEMKAPPLKEM
ncbi:DUF5996 family protein [Xanthovirga aplysinae]|uniref:DUF5996 family protein n=1 Tax=Xanthovirga aplysinae TaxID=2529853 RepID=UPI0012BD4042|nr:DUF5996 family protein [Xanthovirga aplysinae]MTI30412.1 hypothetical protein [Xanthovirga aplysinae]